MHGTSKIIRHQLLFYYFLTFLFRLFYKENKSIEISYSSQSCSCVDYLISDTLTGRYYTCYSLNERSGQIDELKLCIDNIPSFKQNLNKLLGYSNIILKRLNSINYVTNYLTCLSLARNRAKFESITDNSNEIKTQSVIPNVGHFKYFYNNTIFIQFIDKIKLYAESESINSYNVSADVETLNEKCVCTVVLPDMSQHEINFANANFNFFGKYIDFLIQWLRWLFPDKFEIKKETNDENIDINSIKYHVNRLKLFNFTIEQDVNCNNNKNEVNNTSFYDLIAVTDVLKANSEFLKNISKNDS